MANKPGLFRLLAGFALLVLTLLLFGTGCDLAKDTADTAQQDGQGAAGIADKMSKGTVGDELGDE
jgi:hypothetical protein